MRRATHRDWAKVAASLINRENWIPAVTVELTLDPNRKINRRLTKKGQLIWDATLQDELRNILGKHLQNFVRSPKQKDHWRWTVGVGQTKRGAIAFHIVGFVYDPDGTVDEFSKKYWAWKLATGGDWIEKRGQEHCEEAYGKEGKQGKLGYLLNHHTLLMVDELMCPRKKRRCKNGRCAVICPDKS